MKPTVAVFGNSGLNIGHGVAADLSLAGYEVHLFDLPRFHEMIMPLQKLGGIHVSGDPDALTSRKTGFAKINMITTDPEKALKDADVLFIDIYPAYEIEARFEIIAPYIKDGVIVNFNNYGYWPSLRVADILKGEGKEDVILTETSAPLYVARGKNGYLDFSLMRKGTPLSAFPSRRSSEAFKVLRRLYPTFEPARNVLHTNFDNLNMQGHSSVALLNVAFFERAEEHGETTAYFYTTGITRSTGILAEAQDRERVEVCGAYGVPYTPFRETIKRYYGGDGETLDELELSTEFIKGIPAYSTDIWAQWVKADLSLAMVPFVLLSELAGVSTPIHRGFIDIFGAVLGTDFWETGLTLDRLGLADISVEEIIGYVTYG
jgi:opine dehydrogenase